MSDLSNVPDDKLQEIIDIFDPRQENHRACKAEKIRRENLKYQKQIELARTSTLWSKIAAIAAMLSVIATILVFLLSRHPDTSQHQKQVQQERETTKEVKRSTKPMPTSVQGQKPSSTSRPPSKN